MVNKWKEPPSEGEYVVTIYAVGQSDLIFEDEKNLQEDDIVLSVAKVVKSDGWPIKTESRISSDDNKIKHSEWIQNKTEINGIHTVSGGEKISFPYSFVENDGRIDEKYQSQIIVKRLQIGDEVYFVDDYEIRRCQHQDILKIKSERQKSGALFNLVKGELGEGESIICTDCNSIIM